MAWLAAAAAGLGKAVEAYQIKKQKIAETKAFREAKNRSMAATTREVAEEQRNKEFMHSRAVAVAAFSGAGVDDPGVVKILGDLNAEGEYRIMSRLWAGITEAEGFIFRAKQADKEGDAALVAGIFNVFSAAASSYSGAGGSFGGSKAGGSSAAAIGAGPSGATSVGMGAGRSPR